MNAKDNLSPHFTYGELVATDHSQYVQENFDKGQAFVDTLTALCMTILEPIREKFGPISVNSGYRCPNLNKAVGGSSSSQHLYGQAADIVSIDFPEIDVWDFAGYRYGFGTKVGQLIAEQYTAKTSTKPAYCSWVHISLGSGYRTSTNAQLMTYAKQSGYKTVGSVYGGPPK